MHKYIVLFYVSLDDRKTELVLIPKLRNTVEKYNKQGLHTQLILFLGYHDKITMEKDTAPAHSKINPRYHQLLILLYAESNKTIKRLLLSFTLTEQNIALS
jgi:hypothetical protein